MANQSHGEQAAIFHPDRLARYSAQGTNDEETNELRRTMASVRAYGGDGYTPVLTLNTPPEVGAENYTAPEWPRRMTRNRLV